MPKKKTAVIPAEVLPAPVLPGEGQVDEQLVKEAVEHINNFYAMKGLEMARLIGEYVLGTFFGGDPENFRQRGNDHKSFRKLAEIDELQCSYTFLWRSVSVVDQLRLLPEAVGNALPFTHHTLLLPVKSEKKKVELAQKAVDRRWTKRQLEAEVEKARDKEKSTSKTGRPPLPRFVKAVNRLEGFLEDADHTFGDLDQVEGLKAEEALRLYQAVTGMKLQCEELQKVLEKKAHGFTKVE